MQPSGEAARALQNGQEGSPVVAQKFYCLFPPLKKACCCMGLRKGILVFTVISFLRGVSGCVDFFFGNTIHMKFSVPQTSVSTTPNVPSAATIPSFMATAAAGSSTQPSHESPPPSWLPPPTPSFANASKDVHNQFSPVGAAPPRELIKPAGRFLSDHPPSSALANSSLVSLKFTDKDIATAANFAESFYVKFLDVFYWFTCLMSLLYGCWALRRNPMDDKVRALKACSMSYKILAYVAVCKGLMTIQWGLETRSWTVWIVFFFICVTDAAFSMHAAHICWSQRVWIVQEALEAARLSQVGEQQQQVQLSQVSTEFSREIMMDKHVVVPLMAELQQQQQQQ
eukprot:GHVS01087284.1.p1 GENE.GHVS01087284.1~~GHVS01087284.1.p1  ORF type:complete len:341 (+),score=65.97 GHVS01087284.1:83-1105(+)